MSRKQFIESNGATCANWNWSWSFINPAEKFIIFGAWDKHTGSGRSLIFSEEWQTLNGRKQPGYEQSREHIRLIEEEGYQLKTFPMKYSDEYANADGSGRAKIESFEQVLTDKHLSRDGHEWYATDKNFNFSLPDEVDSTETYIEGAVKTVQVNAYERNPHARAKCIEHHGTKCVVCSFDFKEVYGDIGEDYIHVHHIKPLHQIKSEYVLNPINDLIPVCPNCHAMLHKTDAILQKCLSVKELNQRLLLK